MSELNVRFIDSMQVEESFYQAFCNRDIDLMRHVWEQSDEIICIHPGTSRIYSFDLIIASWQEIFSAPEALSIELSEQVYRHAENTSIHYVKENLFVDQKLVGLVYATNIYSHTAKGWKMVTHHATPAFSGAKQNINPSLH